MKPTAIRYLISRGGGIFKNLYFLVFLNGFFLAFLFFFRIEDRYENGLFDSIKIAVNSGLGSRDTHDSVVIKAMDYCHQLMSNRAATFSGNSDLGPEATIFHSTAVDLMTTMGECGSYSEVLARILSNYHYSVRIAQMRVNGIYGGHNVVEVKTDSNWVALDPTYDLYFVRPDNHLASFADIQQDWAFYSRQLPGDYKPAYRYEAVRYTNWTKIPVLFPFTKYLLDHSIGATRANNICLRTLFLDTYANWFYVLLCLYIPLLWTTARRLIAKCS